MPASVPTIDKSISDNLRIASFLATLMVLSRHAMDLEAFYGIDNPCVWITKIEYGMSIFTEIAVPYFFVVSGFFFFQHNYYERGEYYSMVKHKLQTLFIPFIIWNVVGAPLFFFKNPHEFNQPLWNYLTQLLNSDWYGPLWYVRDLMLFMILVPIYQWAISMKCRWFTGMLLLAVLYHWSPIDCSLLSSEGLVFFILGGILARYPQSLSYRIPVLILLLITGIWLYSCFSMIGWSGELIHKLNTTVGVFIFWQWLGFIQGRIRMFLLRVSQYSFFVYVLHFYIEKALKVTVAYYFPMNDIVALLTFLLLPIIVAALLVEIGVVYKKYIPSIYSFSTGGR